LPSTGKTIRRVATDLQGAVVSNQLRILSLVLLTSLVALVPATTQAHPSGAGIDAKTLCVGGPHCFATIQAAVNAASDGNTIRIGPGRFAGGVTIDRSVTLIGVAAASTRISGGGPVLTIGSTTATPTVTLSDLTIIGGDTSTDPQAPRYGPDLTTCGPGYPGVTALGGGIEAFPGTNVAIRNSAIIGNRALPDGSVPSVVATCPGDVPCRASFGDAAGIDDWGAMTLTGTTVSGNQAAAVQSDGGGIVVESGASLSLLESAVSRNSASAVPPVGRVAAGGGIYVDGDGALTVNRSSIDSNTVSLANSIASPYPESDEGTDQENAEPAGVFLADGSSATIRNSTLDRNAIAVNTPLGQAFGADAALCACGDVPLTIANSQIDGNTLTVNVLSSDANGASGPAAIEADANATITNTRIAGNETTVTTTTGDAAAIGAVGFFFAGTVTPTMTGSDIIDNRSTANAPDGTATVQGAGISNNGPLVLASDRVSGNTGSANGESGSAQGGGIWNGLLFGGPTSPLTLQHTTVTHNTLTGGPPVSLQGGGIYTLGFPTTLANSIVAANTPDQCDGC
jgi:hypothetical protein